MSKGSQLVFDSEILSRAEPTDILKNMHKTKTRRQEIFRIVSNENVNVEELSQRFPFPESTIRRDLVELANSGQILRTYGDFPLLHNPERESSLRSAHPYPEGTKGSNRRIGRLAGARWGHPYP